MNTISSTIGPVMAMDGRSFFNTSSAGTQKQLPETNLLPMSAAEVSQHLAENLAKTEKTVQELQQLSDMALGHKVQFTINSELDKVIVEVVDPETDKVIRQIPSEDLQKIQIQMKHAIGLLFDEMI
ncbi:MAG: flagellar protein FlaG [Treponema sp.]|nr:flagellar protein FlaG [Treponema sp.]